MISVVLPFILQEGLPVEKFFRTNWLGFGCLIGVHLFTTYHYFLKTTTMVVYIPQTVVVFVLWWFKGESFSLKKPTVVVETNKFSGF